MRLAEDNDVVQALAPDRSDQSLGNAILPRRGWCNWLISDAHGAKSACDNGAVDPIAVSDHIARGPIPGKCLGDLACNPLRCRVGCDVDPYEISAMKPHDDKAIQQSEADSRDHEQIHGSNVRSVVSQKGLPPLTGRSTTLDHVL